MELHRAMSDESGQVTVEAALTLPLMIFLILGTLQLTMMYQARVMAEYAAFRAVRAGSTHHGECGPMLDAAIAAVLPTIARTDNPATFAAAWERHGVASRNQYQYRNGRWGGPLIQIERVRPQQADIPGPQDVDFDLPGRPPMHLDARVIFWYPLRIPFADWVMTQMYLSYFGFQAYTERNPLIPTKRNANWQREGTMNSQVAAMYGARAGAGEYVVPIIANYSMRMMTPANRSAFASPVCDN